MLFNIAMLGVWVNLFQSHLIPSCEPIRASPTQPCYTGTQSNDTQKDAKRRRKEMRVNKVITKMKAGEMAYGCGFSFSSPTLIELAGRAGFDFVSFDSEHGPFTIDLLDDLCRFADMAGMTPMARVPDIEHPTILRFLDRGIMGITGPHIVNGDRAQQLADSCRYVPRGHRSFGSGRGAYFSDFPSGPDYMGAHQRQHPGHRPA